jgi:hypothetical protein
MPTRLGRQFVSVGASRLRSKKSRSVAFSVQAIAASWSPEIDTGGDRVSQRAQRLSKVASMTYDYDR